MKNNSKNNTRAKRHLRIRRKIVGTLEKPRLNVYRGLKSTYVQLIDDINGHSLLGCSSLSKECVAKSGHSKNNKQSATALGEIIAIKANEKGIKKVVFDRSGYKYHGRIKALADAARKQGLEF